LFVGPDGEVVDATGPIEARELRARIQELWS
jgi:hypothetical protein